MTTFKTELQVSLLLLPWRSAQIPSLSELVIGQVGGPYGCIETTDTVRRYGVGPEHAHTFSREAETTTTTIFFLSFRYMF